MLTRGGHGGASSSSGEGELREKQRVRAELIRDYTTRSVDDYIKHHNCAVMMGQLQQQGSIDIPKQFLEFLEKSLSNRIGSKKQLKITKNRMISDGSAVNEIKEYCEKYMGDTIEEIHENCKNKMKEFMFNNAVKNGSTACSICLEEFQEDKVIVKTKCNHYFHRDCISKNFKEGSANFKKCPICRATLELDDNEDVS
uniref:RING-type domain-containing protein n=1 Tax=Meloidogyne floridensis TaxID=298350 RepID=A0A915PC71_9BILA